jgi:GDP-L-fucose synthase
MKIQIPLDTSILITGAHGMVGTAIVQALRDRGYSNLLVPTRSDVNWLSAEAARQYFAEREPAYVFHIAAVVFGLGGNMRNQLASLSQNTLINQNVFLACAEHRVKKIFFAGTVASYPFPYRSLPLAEVDLFEGVPHGGEFGYACAKRHAAAYLEILRTELKIPFTYGLFTNMYGPNDRFDIENSHVIPSLIRKLYDAKLAGTAFKVWGDGTARRDFMHVKDAAAAAVLSFLHHDGFINICSGQTASMRDVVNSLVKIQPFDGKIEWDPSAPSGIPERSVSNKWLSGLGFKPAYNLEAGLADAFHWYINHLLEARQ